MLGVIVGLRQEGVDLGAADLIVGTSAGARVGAQLATATIEQVVGMHRNGDLPPAEPYATLPQFLAASILRGRTAGVP
jgi:NTE family protein